MWVGCADKPRHAAQEYMQYVTAVEAEWLAEYGHMFFSVKEDIETRVLKRLQRTAEKGHMEDEMAAALEQMRQRELADAAKVREQRRLPGGVES